MASPELHDRVRDLDTPTLSDALDALGLPAGIGGFSTFGTARRVVGPARTVRLVVDDGVPRDRHLCADAIASADPGSVIVVEHHGREDAAGWGGLLTVAALEAGVDGVVVDGACRDVDDYVDLDFTVLAKRAVPATARGRVVEAESGGPVHIGGIEVTSGDWIVADRSGVVVIPAARLDDVVTAGERIQRREQLMVADLRAGAPVTVVLGRDYETMLDGGTDER